MKVPNQALVPFAPGTVDPLQDSQGEVRPLWAEIEMVVKKDLNCLKQS